MNPTPQIDETFQKRVDELSQYASAEALAMTGAHFRKWYINAMAKDDRPASLTDLPGIRKAFDRNQLNEDFLEAVKNEDGLRSVTVLAQLQITYLSSLERDFRMRTRSRIRMMAHESTRRMVHGHENGSIRQGPIRWCKLITQMA